MKIRYKIPDSIKVETNIIYVDNLIINSYSARKLLAILAKNPQIISFGLNYNSIIFGQAATSYLSMSNTILNALKRLVRPNITFVILKNSTITVEGGLMLYRYLQQASNLSMLNVYQNVYGYTEQFFHEKNLIDIIKINNNITDITIKGINSTAIKTLSHALITNPTLTSLTIGNSNLKNTDVLGVFWRALENNPSITTIKILEVSGNNFRALSSFLSQNTTLNNLHLIKNNIGDDELQIISVGLRSNSILNTLLLTSNSITNKGVKFLANALKANSSITNLDLTHNDSLTFSHTTQMLKSVVNNLTFSYTNL